MRLSDAGMRQRQMKLIYADHRPPPWLTEDAARDRSNRLLGVTMRASSNYDVCSRGVHDHADRKLAMKASALSGVPSQSGCSGAPTLMHGAALWSSEFGQNNTVERVCAPTLYER